VYSLSYSESAQLSSSSFSCGGDGGGGLFAEEEEEGLVSGLRLGGVLAMEDAAIANRNETKRNYNSAIYFYLLLLTTSCAN
jgi:hypothetical protein